MKHTTLSTLEMLASRDDEFSEVVDGNLFLILKQLEKSNYIYAKLGAPYMGAPEKSVNRAGLTTDGRLLMEKLQAEREDRRLSNRIWKFGWPISCAILGALFGIVAPLLTDYLKLKLGL